MPRLDQDKAPPKKKKPGLKLPKPGGLLSPTALPGTSFADDLRQQRAVLDKIRASTPPLSKTEAVPRRAAPVSPKLRRLDAGPETRIVGDLYDPAKQSRDIKGFQKDLLGTSSVGSRDLGDIWQGLSPEQQNALLDRYPAAMPEVTLERLRVSQLPQPKPKKPGLLGRILGHRPLGLGPSLTDAARLLGAPSKATLVAERKQKFAREASPQALWKHATPQEKREVIGGYYLQRGQSREEAQALVGGLDEAGLDTAFTSLGIADEFRRSRVVPQGLSLQEQAIAADAINQDFGIFDGLLNNIARDDARSNAVAEEEDILIRLETGATGVAASILLDPTIALPPLKAVRTISTVSKSRTFLKTGGEKALLRIADDISVIGANAVRVSTKYKIPIEVAEQIVAEPGNVQRTTGILKDVLGKEWTPRVSLSRTVTAGRTALSRESSALRRLRAFGQPARTTYQPVTTQVARKRGLRGLRTKTGKLDARIRRTQEQIVSTEVRLRNASPTAVRQRQQLAARSAGLKAQHGALSQQRRLLQGNLETASSVSKTADKLVKTPKQRYGLRHPLSASKAVTVSAARKVVRAADTFVARAPEGVIEYEVKEAATNSIKTYARALHLGADVEDELANKLLKAGTAKEANAVVTEVVARYAVQHGVAPNKLVAFYARQRGEFTRKMAGKDPGVFSPTGSRTPLSRTQIKNRLYLPDAADLKRAVHDLKKGVTPRMQAGALKRGLKAGHRAWKFTIVTGPSFATAALGQVPGLALGTIFGAPRLIKGAASAAIRRDADKLIWSAKSFASQVNRARVKGATVGAFLGGAHYVTRVVLLEELMVRSLATRGLGKSVVDRIPFGWGKSIREIGLTQEQRRFAEFHTRSVRLGVAANPETDWAMGRLGSRVQGTHLVGSSHPEYLDAWYHAVNFQLHQSDPLLRTLAEARFGTAAERASAQKLAANWLRADDVGKKYLRDMKSVRGLKSAEKVVDRAQQLVDELVTHPNVLQQWLTGPVEKSVLADLAKKGASPKLIHAPDRLLLNPLKPSDLQNLVGKAVLSGPTNALNRFPYAQGVFYDEYRRLLNDGLDAGQAAKLAATRAVRETNQVMFKLDGVSRFAKKADYVFPFQSVREELVSVYAKILTRNPVRVYRLAKGAGAMFELAKEEGWAVKDDFGEWQMRIPLGGGFRLPLKSLSFFGTGGGAFFGASFLPQPGGPYWSSIGPVLIEKFPSVFADHPKIAEWLFPFGPNGSLTRKNLRDIAAGLQPGFGPAWWELTGKREQQNSLNKEALRVYRAMHVAWKNGEGPEPTPELVQQRVKGLILGRGLISSLMPNVQFELPQEEDFREAQETYKEAYGSFDVKGFLTKYPQYSVNFVNGKEWEGPEEYWKQPGHPADATNEGEKFIQRHGTRYFTPKEFQAEVKKSERITEGFTKLNNLNAEPLDPTAYYLKRETLFKQYPEMVDSLDNANQRDADYAKWRAITSPAEQEKALKQWRFTYKVSRKTEAELAQEWLRGRLVPNAWNQARDTDDIVAEYRSTHGGERGPQLEKFLKKIPAVEAVKLLTDMRRRTDSLDEYRRLGKLLGDVYDAHPEILRRQPVEKVFETQHQRAVREYLEKGRELNEDMQNLYGQAAVLKDQMTKARLSKNWGLYYNLKDKRTRIFNAIKALKESVYRKYPNWTEVAGSLNEGWLTLERGDSTALFNEFAAKNPDLAWLAMAPEERQWQAMNDPVREQSLNELRDRLTGAVKHEDRLQWDWLTDFQQKLITDKFGETYARQAASGKRDGGTGLGSADGEIGWATAQFKKYNRRGGRKAPAGYATYLKLKDKAAKFSYLKQHPEVQEWVRLGPMSNMPPLIRNMVVNVMVKHGKWEGEELSIEAITEISFAQEQLQKWTRRKPGESAPAAFDLWLKMPTGAGKAEYLRAHPEVQDWIGRGPMSNMPDAFREVVREIMYAYGLWGESQNPLGKLLEEYHDLPPQSKNGFLEAHPELVEYWRALRPADERGLYDLAQKYFGIGDQTARRMFLESNPELKQYFVKERERRYERFLTRVSFFLGANPEIITSYLENQTATLQMLLRRFGERPLTVENVVTRTTRTRRSA